MLKRRCCDACDNIAMLQQYCCDACDNIAICCSDIAATLATILLRRLRQYCNVAAILLRRLRQYCNVAAILLRRLRQYCNVAAILLRLLCCIGTRGVTRDSRLKRCVSNVTKRSYREATPRIIGRILQTAKSCGACKRKHNNRVLRRANVQRLSKPREEKLAFCVLQFIFAIKSYSRTSFGSSNGESTARLSKIRVSLYSSKMASRTQVTTLVHASRIVYCITQHTRFAHISFTCHRRNIYKCPSRYVRTLTRRLGTLHAPSPIALGLPSLYVRRSMKAASRSHPTGPGESVDDSHGISSFATTPQPHVHPLTRESR
ncbi:uncharacterized protein LOC112589466 isoform X2 [Harpegnathos saltator]|uniref:uncharacterized protein LOC112589466 isoform X2 n=1 Tax=Harpegnathos saltator TaxID=610380 RepID=UPI000DBED8D9|nr:uncharacterized protein LOC112589466 isoform X2 [Harpegnathos saltator]